MGYYGGGYDQQALDRMTQLYGLGEQYNKAQAAGASVDQLNALHQQANQAREWLAGHGYDWALPNLSATVTGAERLAYIQGVALPRMQSDGYWTSGGNVAAAINPGQAPAAILPAGGGGGGAADRAPTPVVGASPTPAQAASMGHGGLGNLTNPAGTGPLIGAPAVPGGWIAAAVAVVIGLLILR